MQRKYSDPSYASPSNLRTSSHNNSETCMSPHKTQVNITPPKAYMSNATAPSPSGDGNATPKLTSLAFDFSKVSQQPGGVYANANTHTYDSPKSVGGGRNAFIASPRTPIAFQPPPLSGGDRRILEAALAGNVQGMARGVFSCMCVHVDCFAVCVYVCVCVCMYTPWLCVFMYRSMYVYIYIYCFFVICVYV